ncbi:MAG: di-heme-cytochrome C peroxidase, partial [Nitrosomonas sp.]|nr:di-heme-cytochrome C peroxidase [Nitrosomonas sp.]
MHSKFSHHYLNPIKLLILILSILAIIWLVTGISWRTYELRDIDPNRGAITNGIDKFGDQFSQIVYLDQGWSAADSLWFYNTTQGSNLLPYSFFLVLEQSDSSALFRSDENIDRYGYLPQRSTASNPDGLPVGMVRDEYRNKAFMGFTCAACHTTQINFAGTGIRIDGGPANSDMESFMIDLAAALYATLETPEKLDRFV